MVPLQCTASYKEEVTSATDFITSCRRWKCYDLESVPLASWGCNASGIRMSRIAIVVDQPTTRMLLSKLASQLDINVEVKAFSNPSEAILDLERNHPDLLISELTLTGFDGAELIRRFRAIPGCALVPVAVITTPEDAELRTLARRFGVTDFLLLPLDYDEFRSRMRALLEMYSRQKPKGWWYGIWSILWGWGIVAVKFTF
jgi:CheY-like chemotaxis protein